MDRWTGLTCKSNECPNGFTYDGAASMSALLGRPEAAVGNLTGFLLSGKVHDSTMYAEGDNPCIESPLAAANSLQELLLTSWGGRLRLFPGLPASYPEAVFDGMLAEGGFEVSGRRSAGASVFFQVRSLRPGTSAPLICDTDMVSGKQPESATPGVLFHPNGTIVLPPLAQGEVAVVQVKGATSTDLTISPLPGLEAEFNVWGSPKGPRSSAL